MMWNVANIICGAGVVNTLHVVVDMMGRPGSTQFVGLNQLHEDLLSENDLFEVCTGNGMHLIHLYHC